MRELLSTWLNSRVIFDFHEFLLDERKPEYEKCEKKALLSYLVMPLIPPAGMREKVTFSNAGIAQYIPRALNELGYTVDIVNYDNKEFVPKKKYDLFIGHLGINFETISRHLDPECTRISFATGIQWEEWNRFKKERQEALGKRRNILLPAERIVDYHEEFAYANSDGIICLGNDYAKKTFEKYPRVININNAVYPDTYSPENKNFHGARNNFLFFNGSGNVRKGLDLVLEAFTHVEQHLYVRQDIEPEFFKVYKKELTEYPNIHLVPFLDKPSDDFFAIMDTCNFIIAPTCAEGQPGSVIECMAHGLIPIVSREANIDTKEFGITLKENSIEEIISVVKEVSQKPDEWYREKSSLTLDEIRQSYTPEHFLKNMKDAILTVSKEKADPETR
jgi:hypothetical protein